MCILDVTFTWVDVESNETLEQSWRGTGQNGFDKSFGSALTYAERYFLLKTFHIATDRDDVDALAAVRDEAVEEAARYAVSSAAGRAHEPEAPQAPAAQEAAPAAPAAAQFKAPRWKTVEDLAQDKEFWQWVDLAAQGRRSKNNKPAREAWIGKYNPTEEQLEYFDSMAANRKVVFETAEHLRD